MVLTVVGVNHNFYAGSLNETISLIDKETPPKIVSLESPWTLEDLLSGESSPDTDKKYVIAIARKLHDRGFIVQSVEDMGLYEKQIECSRRIARVITARNKLDYGHPSYESWRKIGFDTTIEDCNRVYSELTFLRSIGLYELAIKNDSDILITGSTHAYEMVILGMDIFSIFLFELADSKKRRSELTANRYLSGEFNREQLLELNVNLI